MNEIKRAETKNGNKQAVATSNQTTGPVHDSHDRVQGSWKDYLADSCNDDLFINKRARAVWKLVSCIKDTYAGQNIVVVSRCLMFLDILAEALPRKKFKENEDDFMVLRYDGTRSKINRAATLELLNFGNRLGTVVLLMSAGSG
jgi:hypothetical protein